MKKNLSLKDPIKLSEKALALNDIEGAGTLPMEANQYTVDQLLTALLVGNSSTAALALAEKVGGSEKSFVEKMKQKLSEWGIQSPHLINATGLNTQTISGDPDGKEDENQLSAMILLLLPSTYSRIFLSDQIYFKTDSSFFRNTQIENPQPDARKACRITVQALTAFGSATLPKEAHLCCINDAKWHPHDHGCPRSGGS